ncbi:MAG: molecular chaperone [Cellulosilyticaceae bacterium]
MTYTYKLYKNNEKMVEEKQYYRETELIKMTTYQLKEICIKEKLIKSRMSMLEKEELIRLIMRYRGKAESRLIQTNEEEGNIRLQKLIDSIPKMPRRLGTIKAPAKLKVYQGMAMNEFDTYKLDSDITLDEGNILVVDENFKLCGILNGVYGIDNAYYLTKTSTLLAVESMQKHYRLLYFKREQSEIIYDIYYNKTRNLPAHLEFQSIPILDWVIKDVAAIDTPLAIDFGTSSTTAGINSTRIVQIIDSLSVPKKTTPLIPSVVGIKEIAEDGKVTYLFGYEALELAKKSYVDEGICTFYDIKRWVNDYEKQEKITDLKGNKAFITRKAMIKAFLEYVIDLAGQQFKCKFKKLHISCPSKQKQKFHQFFKEILPAWEIEYENMLDEGVAVLFNTITNIIEKKRYEEGKTYKALIIDCGGGTTDLSSCTFKIKSNRIGYKIDIETGYENGDTNFGGNNLTFRIMQWLKILLAYQLTQQTEKLAALQESFEIDLFRSVDSQGIDEIYKNLDTDYQAVHEIIPTQFKDYENTSSEDYLKVKNNFYTLFEMAEKIKKQFFINPNQLMVTVGGEENDCVNYDKWKIHSYKEGKLVCLQEERIMHISRYTIQTLLKADIYNLIKKFLEPMYEAGELSTYTMIKLTGQSCKVDVFREAIKEFIPGRIIHFGATKNEVAECYNLKLSCLKGALQYLEAKQQGYIDANIHTVLPSLPYTITATTHTGIEKILIHSAQNKIMRGNISRFKEEITLKLTLKDAEGNTKCDYAYHNKLEDFTLATVETIEKSYTAHIMQEELDNIINNEIKFFVWAKPKEWGFLVVPVLRKEEELYIGKEEFFLFENATWENNFFDGTK